MKKPFKNCSHNEHCCSVAKQKHSAGHGMRPQTSIISSVILLKRLSLKATKSRLAVLDILNKSDKPVSVRHILQELKLAKIKTNEATVYRILESLVSVKAVKKIDLRLDSSVFEIINPDHHHHFIVCNHCGLTETFSMCTADSWIEKIKNNSKNFKIIEDHSFELFGLCKKCSK